VVAAAAPEIFWDPNRARAIDGVGSAGVGVGVGSGVWSRTWLVWFALDRTSHRRHAGTGRKKKKDDMSSAARGRGEESGATKNK
jgi:hypothetical protein